jgi:hypothetical protein
MVAEELTMTLGAIGRIALRAHGVDRATAFDKDTLLVAFLYRYGDLSFFNGAASASCCRSRRNRNRVAFQSGRSVGAGDNGWPGLLPTTAESLIRSTSTIGLCPRNVNRF